MPSGADLEYAKMLAQAGVLPANAAGYDGSRLEQLVDSNELASGVVPANVEGRLDAIEAFFDVDVIDAVIETEVQAATAGHVPGSRRGYMQSTAAFSTTAKTPTLTLVAPLTHVVMGQGRDVEIKYFTPLLYNLDPAASVFAAIITQIVGSGANVYEQVVEINGRTSKSEPLVLTVDKALVDGTNYTVAAAVCGSVGSMDTVYGASGGLQRHYLKVISE